MLVESDLGVSQTPSEAGPDAGLKPSTIFDVGSLLGTNPWARNLWFRKPNVSLGWLNHIECVVITSLVDVRRMVDELMASPTFVTYDTETTGLRVIDDDIVATQFSGDGQRAFFLAHNMVDPAFVNLPLGPVLEICKPLWERGVVGHNVGYDWKMTVQHGVDFQIEADTQLECRLFDVDRLASLKDCLRDLLGLDEVIKYKDLFDKKVKRAQWRFDIVPYDKAVPYACQDPIGTWRLHDFFLANGVSPQDFIYELEHACIKPFSRMELLGVQLDIERLAKAREEAQKAIDAAQVEVDTLAGHPVALSKPAELRKLLFEELQLPIQKKSALTRAASTDAESLDGLESLHPIITPIKTWRKMQKLVSGFLGALPDFVQSDGCIHTHYNQMVRSGRVSSSDPNLQNAPKKRNEKDVIKGAIRASFIPPKGFVGFLDCDYSQIEYRLFASLSGDQSLLDAFYNNVDVHQQTASTMMGVPLDQVDKELRQRGKTLNFAAIYGQGCKALAETLGISEYEAEELQSRYWAKMPQAAAFCEQLRQFARANGYCQTYFGRKRALPNINSPNKFLRFEAERIAVNSPVQGSAADLLKLAIVRLDAEMQQSFKSRLCLNVHDELVIAHHPDDALDALAEAVRGCMEITMPGWCPTIAEPAYGTNWGEVEDFKFPSRREDTAQVVVTPVPVAAVTAPVFTTNDRLTIMIPDGTQDEVLDRIASAVSLRPGPIPLEFVVGGERVLATQAVAVDRQFLLQLRAEGFQYEMTEGLQQRMLRVA